MRAAVFLLCAVSAALCAWAAFELGKGDSFAEIVGASVLAVQAIRNLLAPWDDEPRCEAPCCLARRHHAR